MNAAIAHRGIVDVDARTEGDAAIIAARAFRAAGDVLRTIINGVLIKRMRRRRGGRFIVRTASKSFMIGTSRRTSRRERSPGSAVIVGVGGVAGTGGELKPEDASRVAIDKADRIETGLNWTKRIFPESARGTGGIVKANSKRLGIGGKERHAAGIDLVV